MHYLISNIVGVQFSTWEIALYGRPIVSYRTKWFIVNDWMFICQCWSTGFAKFKDAKVSFRSVDIVSCQYVLTIFRCHWCSSHCTWHHPETGDNGTISGVECNCSTGRKRKTRNRLRYGMYSWMSSLSKVGQKYYLLTSTNIHTLRWHRHRSREYIVMLRNKTKPHQMIEQRSLGLLLSKQQYHRRNQMP